MDEAFNAVRNGSLTGYEMDFAVIAAHGGRNPRRVMENFFVDLEWETGVFRDRYADQMHRTVRRTIWEPYRTDLWEAVYEGLRWKHWKR